MKTSMQTFQYGPDQHNRCGPCVPHQLPKSNTTRPSPKKHTYPRGHKHTTDNNRAQNAREARLARLAQICYRMRGILKRITPRGLVMLVNLICDLHHIIYIWVRTNIPETSDLSWSHIIWKLSYIFITHSIQWTAQNNP